LFGRKKKYQVVKSKKMRSSGERRGHRSTRATVVESEKDGGRQVGKRYKVVKLIEKWCGYNLFSQVSRAPAFVSKRRFRVEKLLNSFFLEVAEISTSIIRKTDVGKHVP